MKTEKRLIDGNKAQAVLVNMAEHLMEAGNPEMAGAVGYAAEVIGKQRTVDAVEVVRCKDCKHFYHSVSSDRDGRCVQFGTYDTDPSVYLNDFCSYGERRNDG